LCEESLKPYISYIYLESALQALQDSYAWPIRNEAITEKKLAGRTAEEVKIQKKN